MGKWFRSGSSGSSGSRRSLGVPVSCMAAALTIPVLPLAAQDSSRSLEPPPPLSLHAAAPAEQKSPVVRPAGPVEQRIRAAPEIPGLNNLVLEALQANPEIEAMHKERIAARSRIAPAGALDDPMLEAGLVNVPTDNFRFDREEMTMKMVGIAQRFPYPGKRALRESIASKEAEGIGHGFWEAAGRVARDVKVAYFDLALVREMRRVAIENRATLERFLLVAESRYRAGQAGLADVFKAQVQITRMLDELIRLDREEPMIVAELNRALGRAANHVAPATVLPVLQRPSLDLEALREAALRNRPQLAALRSTIARAEKSTELARKDFYPDFDLRFAYGQRDNAPDGMRRSDMVSITVAVNLPLWRETKREPKVAEAQAMREQVRAQLQAQQNEISAKLRQQIAIAEQSVRSASLYANDLRPQAELAVEAALVAYEVNRGDLFSLLDNQMAVFNVSVSRAAALTAQAKAFAEIEFLTGELAAHPPEFLRAMGDVP
jgi:cobalt-zinc-cadmium efflux system outer membrane protein